MVEATRNLTDAITTMRSERTQPDTESLAMREIQDDASYGARSGLDDPFTVIHSSGGLALLAATDHVRAYGDAFGENSNGAKISDLCALGGGAGVGGFCSQRVAQRAPVSPVMSE